MNHNGYEAEELCRYETLVEDILDSGCDLVLLDINLPVVDGQYLQGGAKAVGCADYHGDQPE